MKKIVLCILFTIITTQFVSAQDKVYYGAKVGGNISHFFYQGEDKSFNDRSKMKLASHFGAFAEIILNDYYAIQPELLFSTKGARFSKSDENDYQSAYVLKYLSLPVIAKYYVTKSFSIEAGPQFAYLLSAKDVIRDDEYQTNYGEEAAVIEMKDDLTTLDIGIVVGTGYVFDTGLYLSARYNVGINNTYKSFTGFDDHLQNGTIQFSIGYSLNY